MFIGTKNETQTIKTLKLSFVERRNGLAYLSVDRLNIVEGEDADTVADLSGPPVAVLLDHLDRLSRLKSVTIFRFEKRRQIQNGGNSFDDNNDHPDI